MTSRKTHWDRIYSERKPDEVSWYQENPAMSLAMIQRARVPEDGRIIDIGGGASRLVDALLSSGYWHVSVLDISARALELARERLAALASKVTWFEADVTTFAPTGTYDLWHDRAVFHFLTDAADRKRYVDVVRRSLAPDGTLILAAFAPEGPEKCSGLPVRRYDAALVREAFGVEFRIAEEASESHQTPWQTAQQFNYFLLKRAA